MLFTAILFLVSATNAAIVYKRQNVAGSQVCQDIAGNITGEVYYSDSVTTNYATDIEHWMISSTQSPECVVEVASAQDVSNVLKIVGSTRTPFAIKSGGHASNPGFSSTPGVHISLAKMTQIILSADKKTVEIGLGNTWVDVYQALNGSGVNVVGGRVPGPGTGGFTLGGGYSWLSDQYGLTCDTVISYNLVLPNGSITTVEASSNSDLTFALKGGLNRFGIVTSIVYKTVPQPNLVYGGYQYFESSAILALINATYTFQTTNKDPKAQVILTVNGGEAPGAILILFYDGPERPAAFNPYNSITGAIINTLAVQSFYSFVNGIPSLLESGNRGAFASVSTTTYTIPFLEAVYNETTFYGDLAALNSGLLISYDVEPFLKYGKYATESSYPHSDSQLPLNLFYSWSLAADDEYWRGLIQQSVDHLTDIAKAEGIYYNITYPNYSLNTYTGPQLYGVTNAARLRAIQAKIDPAGVMELAGGFSF